MTTRDERRRATDAKVLDAASELFRARGFEATTIRDIAATAGVSAGTVIAAGDKDRLLLASIDRLISGIHRARVGSPGPDDGSGVGPVERIASLFDPFVDLFTADPELARSYAAVLARGRVESRTFAELADALVEEIEVELRRAGVRDAGPVAHGIYLAYIGRLFTWPAREGRNADGLKRGLRDVVAAIWRADAS